MHSKRLTDDVCAASEPRLLRDEDADSGDCDSKSETSERSSTSTSSTNIDLDETAEALQRLTALLARERLTPVRAQPTAPLFSHNLPTFVSHSVSCGSRRATAALLGRFSTPAELC
jgi:hypothetical protein